MQALTGRLAPRTLSEQRVREQYKWINCIDGEDELVADGIRRATILCEFSFVRRIFTTLRSHNRGTTSMRILARICCWSPHHMLATRRSTQKGQACHAETTMQSSAALCRIIVHYRSAWGPWLRVPVFRTFSVFRGSSSETSRHSACTFARR